MAAALEGADSAVRFSSEEERKQVLALVERIDYDGATGQLTIHWKAASGRAALVRTLHFRTGRCGRKRLSDEVRPAEESAAESVPRLARLMALALRLEGLVRDGRVSDYAGPPFVWCPARLGHVSRARLSQILGLVLLAPDIQEQLLFLSTGRNGRLPLSERRLRPIAAEPDWRRQRRLWRRLAVPVPNGRPRHDPTRDARI